MPESESRLGAPVLVVSRCGAATSALVEALATTIRASPIQTPTRVAGPPLGAAIAFHRRVRRRVYGQARDDGLQGQVSVELVRPTET